MTEPRGSNRLLLWASILAYLLIGVEIVIMISPFALYFYSVYGPVLEFFARFPALSWTTEFFLPHMVFPDDLLITAISLLQILLVVGLVLFLFAAIPLYYGRFTNKGVVRASFYARIRHPQYLFLAISGLGMLLYWPRFIILVLYITMLFVYYILARNEEWRMQLEAPGRYEAYMASTPMFLPGEPGGRIFRALFGWIQPKWLGITVAYAVSLLLAILLALSIRGHAVRSLPLYPQAGLTLVSVFPRPAGEVRELYDIISASPAVRRHLQADKGINLGYLMPGDFFLMALVTDADRRFSDDMIERFPEILEWHQYKFRGGLGKFFRIFYNYVSHLGSRPTDYDVERFVFVRVADRDGRPVAADRLFDLGRQRTPALLVDVDASSHEVVSVVPVAGNHKWGGMPMPTF